MRALFAALVLLVVGAGRAEAKVHVVTTIETFADLARRVGGDRVEVKSLSHGYMDPHFVEPKPSPGARSEPRRPARPRRARAGDRLAAAAGARLAQREASGMGSPATSTPRRRSRCSTCRRRRSIARWATSTRRATRTIGSRPTTPSSSPARSPSGSSRSTAPARATYQANLASSSRPRWRARRGEWEKRAAGVRGMKIVTYHKSWSYVSKWLGLQEVGYVEPKPGIPAPPSHIAGAHRADAARGRQGDPHGVVLPAQHRRPGGVEGGRQGAGDAERRRRHARDQGLLRARRRGDRQARLAVSDRAAARQTAPSAERFRVVRGARRSDRCRDEAHRAWRKEPALSVSDRLGACAARRLGFPITLDVEGQAVLVVGDDADAARKRALLEDAGARVTQLAADDFVDAAVDGARLVMCSAREPALAARVSAAARARGVPVWCSDDPERSDFAMPAVAQLGPVRLAVSTSGGSPTLAGKLRADLREAARRALRRLRARAGARGAPADTVDERRCRPRRLRPRDPRALSRLVQPNVASIARARASSRSR